MTDDATRAEIIISAAVMRAELALKEAKRALFGDEETEREAREIAHLDIAARHEPPPAPEARAKLRRLWAWNKRMRGR